MNKTRTFPKVNVSEKLGLFYYTKHHLNHGEEIGVKKLKTVENSFVYGFLRREIPVINGCLVLHIFLSANLHGISRYSGVA